MSQESEKYQARQQFVEPYRKRFYRALEEQIAPVLDAIDKSINPAEVLDQVSTLIKIDPIYDVFKHLYPTVGTEASVLNIEQINAQLRSAKHSSNHLKLKSDVEDLWRFYLQNYVDDNPMSRIVSITSTSREYAERAISEAIDEVLEAGASPRTAQQAIERSVAQEWRRIGIFRAQRIARTEVYTAYSYADFQSATSYTIPLKKQWRHGFIGKQDRPGHIDLNGTKVARDAMFVNPRTGVPMLYPHAPDLPADEVVNCKCSLTYEAE